MSFCLGCFLFVITLLQRRHAYYAALLAAFCALELSALLSVRLRRKMDRIERRKARGVLVTAIFVAFAFPMFLKLPRSCGRRRDPNCSMP